MKQFLFSAAMLLFSLGVQAQARVSVHDPSIVDDNGTYYIFGRHQAWATSNDMYNWSTIPAKWSNGSSNVSCDVAFNTMKVTLSNGDRTLSNFDAEAWAAASKSGYDISGNLWAPDVIYNRNLGKWCMYLSINGPDWNSSIILLTADNIEGPYVYQAPVVVSGFATANVDYKKSDLELVIGEQATLPNRYKSNSYWPHAIDPCVFYDQNGNLWMSYGSWLGGIWILQLDENTGLRDYTVDYGVNSDGTKNKSKDSYFGKKLAGGNFVSGEASYVEYINGYYYLFVTYGGLTADGGYQMRVFRSSNPDGPYNDYQGKEAIFTSNMTNFGPTCTDNRGENIFGAYGNWGNVAVGDFGERSQGHNSVLTKGGRSYLVYHTRFQNRGEEHQVRVHQLFQNQDGWLCATPFEYTGVPATESSIAEGNYKLLIHRFGLNHSNKEQVTPVSVKLQSGGTVSGGVSGSWTASGSNISLTLNGNTYQGVVIELPMEITNESVIAFTAMSSATGETVWGYKAPDGLVGNSVNTTPYFGDFSEQLQLTDGEMATFEFTNYSSKDNNWNNWVACVSTGTTFNAGSPLIALRADNFENVSWSNSGVTSNFNWDTFKNDMDGSQVVLTVKYQNGSVTIHADITTSNGTKYYEEFTKTGVTGTITTCLSVDNSHLVVTKAEVSPITAINGVMQKQDNQNTPMFDLQGRRVNAQYKGIVIQNGKKIIVK